MNLQSGQPIQTQNFIDTYSLGTVLNDFNREFSNRFHASGQPIFAIINGLKDSSSHRQWELLYSRNGYGDLSQPIETFREVLDRVEPVAGGLTYSQWVERSDLNPEQSVHDGDPDGDGLVNAWEFATGTDPLDRDSFHRPGFRVDSDGTVVLSFQAALDLVGIQWKVTRSMDLSVWTLYETPLPSSVANPQGSDVQTLEISLSNASQVLGFYRVEAVFE